MRQYWIIGLLGYAFIGSILADTASAGPSSTNYELKDYGFGAGGSAKSDSTNYSVFGLAGEVESGRPASTNYQAGAGLVYTMQANVPTAPTFTNPATNYDRLKMIIQTGGNPADATYAVAISTDNFVTTSYVQSDGTVGSVLGSEDWQTYTAWGGASGSWVRTLAANTSYKIKVKAKRGNFTESSWGPTATATTATPSLTFGISSSTVTFSNLNSGNSFTDSTKNTILTTSTNAYNGYTVYGRETSALTWQNQTIADYGSPNSNPTPWSGTGFGYTTNDSSLAGGTADRFTNGGTKYAGFTTAAPGDPVADHAPPIDDPTVTTEAFTISYRVTADGTTKAGAYQTNVVYVVVPIY
ncbi:hypothetical protein HY086_04080 [Candidatus Gottesmanbacteria bacterium]|nr:hypothetical protein [Candidatus Gottesmanbacteria bacterium]